jgi:adenine phosphoribosyltransferase
MKKPESYTLHIAGVERDLTIITIAPNLSIASFVMLGDTELIEAIAESIFHHSDFPREKIEMLVCPEAKAIPLTHALAVRLGIDYVVLRKTKKSYMQDCLVETTKSITTSGEQQLVLDGADKARLHGKKICIVDDVVSTGASLKAIENLLAKIDCVTVSKVAALLEEGGYEGRDVLYLERLPVWRATEKIEAVDIEDVRQLAREEMVEQGTLEMKTNSGDGWTAHVQETYAKP